MVIDRSRSQVAAGLMRKAARLDWVVRALGTIAAGCLVVALVFGMRRSAGSLASAAGPFG